MRRIEWLPKISQESVIMALVVGILAFGLVRAQFDGTGKANFNDSLPQNLRIDCIEGGEGQSAESDKGNESIVEMRLASDGKNRALAYGNYMIEGLLYRDATRGQQAQYSLAQKLEVDQDQEENQSYAVAKIIAPAFDSSLKTLFEYGVTLLVNGGDETQSDWFALSEDHTAIHGSAPIDYALAWSKGKDVSEYEQRGAWTLEENGNKKTYVLDFDSISFRMIIDCA